MRKFTLTKGIMSFELTYNNGMYGHLESFTDGINTTNQEVLIYTHSKGYRDIEGYIKENGYIEVFS